MCEENTKNTNLKLNTAVALNSKNILRYDVTTYNNFQLKKIFINFNGGALRVFDPRDDGNSCATIVILR